MAQAELFIGDDNAAKVRAATNAALHALSTQSAGPTPPPQPVAGQLWRDTSGTDDVLMEFRGGAWQVASFGTKGPKGDKGDPGATGATGPRGEGTDEAFHAIEILNHKTLDLTAGPPSTGWVDSPGTAQGGMAVKSGSPFTATEAQNATFGLNPAQPGGKYLAVRLPAASNPAQARVVLRSADGLNYTLQLTSFHLIATTTSWKWYAERLNLGSAVASLKLQLTGDASHVGASRFAGQLTQEPVYEQTKAILKAGAGVAIATDDADSELTISASADVPALEQRLESLEGKTSDLQAGSDAVGWVNASTDSQGGLASAGTAFSLSSARSVSSWVRELTSGIREHLVVRIPATGRAGQYRVRFVSGQATVFEAPLSGFVRLGANQNWQFYSEAHVLGTDIASLTLQVTGSAAHIGTSQFAGSLVRDKVYEQAKQIIQVDSRATVTANDTAETITVGAKPQNGRLIALADVLFGATDPGSTVKTTDTNVPAAATDTQFNLVHVYLTNSTLRTTYTADFTSFNLKTLDTRDRNAALRSIQTTLGTRSFRIWKSTFTANGESFIRLNFKRILPNSGTEDALLKLFTVFAPPTI